MKITPIQKLFDYLRNHEIKNLLATGLIVMAAIAIASIGIANLANTLHNWSTPTMYSNLDAYGRAFNAMVADSIVSLISILPSLPIFLVAYMISQSHPWGKNLSIVLAIGLLAFAFLGNYEFEIILTAGILCVLSGTVSFITQNQKPKTYLPLVTENIAKILAGLTGIIGVAVLFGIIVYIGARGMPYVTWDFVTGKWSTFTEAANHLAAGNLAQMGGISEFIVGSLMLVAFCELIALPLGLGSAIYLSEYSSENRLTNTMRFVIETLAGVPSIVFGLIGFALFVTMLGFGQSILSAGLALAFMILPWNIRVAEEAMRAVPQSYREGSYALGATKWETIKTQVLYAASPGIITGILLGVGAAIGETAVLMWTAGGLEATHLPTAFISPNSGAAKIPTLAMWIYLAWDEFGSAYAPGWTKENVCLAGAFVLLVIFLAISLVALVARNYLSKKIRGH
jgi:phosphate transport system permease protein